MAGRKGRWLALLLVLGVVACSGGGDGSASSDRAGDGDGAEALQPSEGEVRIEGGTATQASTFGPPTYIFPILPAQYVTSANTVHFIPLMYRGLFTVGEDLSLSFDDTIAEEPEFSEDRRSVTVRLREWEWSDGTPLTSRDLEFSFNLIRANKTGFAGYIEGFFPDNVESFETPDERTVVLRLTEPVNPEWFNANQLGNVLPLPQHVWDKTSVNGPIADHDRTPEGAVAVFEFLTSQAEDTSTYASNPLWQVVSGPWVLDAFTPDGRVEWVPNENWSGEVQPTLDRFVLEPFASIPARVNALRSGDGPDVAGLPYSQLDVAPLIEREGYVRDDVPVFGFNYVQLDFAHPEVGAIFRQTYFRQALQHLVDQPSIIEAGFRGVGHPNYGPIPPEPENPYYSDEAEAASPPFDPDAARELLESHGWAVEPDGVSTCERPGDGDDECGPGVAAGARADFTMLAAFEAETPNAVALQSLQSEARQLGIAIEFDNQPFNTVYATTAACAFSEDACTWEMSFYDGWGYGGGRPTGEFLFRTGGKANFGRYSDAETDANVEASIAEDGEEALVDYQARLAEEVPVVFLPGGSFIAMIRSDLRGVTPQSPTLALRPERWYFVEE